MPKTNVAFWMRERGDSHSVDIILDRMRSRMYDLSQFGKTFKETFGRIFRRRRPWCGNLWEGRFKSTLIGEAEYLRICTAYVELNPVRAGLSTSSSGYEWCTTGAAERGNAFAQRCRERLAAVAGFGDSPRSEGWLMRRAPQISCGKIFGNSEFVAESLGLLADRVNPIGDRHWLAILTRPQSRSCSSKKKHPSCASSSQMYSSSLSEKFGWSQMQAPSAILHLRHVHQPRPLAQLMPRPPSAPRVSPYSPHWLLRDCAGWPRAT